MAIRAGIGPACRCLLSVALLLAAPVLAVPAHADGVALIFPNQAFEDVSAALQPVVEPKAEGHDRIAPPEPRFIANEYAYSGWLALNLKNAGDEAIDRVLIFTHPALSRSGILGTTLAAPRLVNLKGISGDVPITLPPFGPANRFARIGIHLEPGQAVAFAAAQAAHGGAGAFGAE